MMEAFDLAKYMVCILLAIIVVNSMNIFPTEYISGDNTFLDKFNYLETSQFDISQNPSILDYGLLAMQWLWQGFVLFINIVLIPVTLLPWLISAFGIPPIIGYILGIFVYFTIATAVLQWLSGKSTGAYE